MCTITGNNLFNQWCTNDFIVTQFSDVPFCLPAEETDPAKASLIKIVEIHWSYNIYKFKDSFYISGTWGGKQTKMLRINLPQECNISKSPSFVITGNDNRLFFVEKYVGKFWIMDENNSVKEITFNEAPIDTSPKRKKEDCTIEKISATNDNFICLTNSNLVYSGMLPSLVNTSHCLGLICDILCGFEHFMLLTDVGRVYTWGNGRRLQLGHGDLENLETPTEVEALAGIKIIKISAGGWHSVALSEFGDLYVWGWNDTGQLGIRSKENGCDSLNSCPLPTLVDLYDGNEEIVNFNVRDVACGSRHTALILEDHSVWTSGYNKYGQLGFEPSVYSKVMYFKKVFKCKSNFKLLCGPWTTVLKDS